MPSMVEIVQQAAAVNSPTAGTGSGKSEIDFARAEAVLQELAAAFFASTGNGAGTHGANADTMSSDALASSLEAKYRALLEQIPAVVFMAYLDRGISEAYVSPEIESALGYSREEWLEDPVRWFERIHPEDKQRWSLEAAEMFLSGKPLLSAYRVIARSGQVVWFRCDARMMRREDGRPWFIHGVAFDISDMKRIEAERQEERNFISAILDTVGALVVVLDDEGHILRFNPACEVTSGYAAEEVQGKYFWDMFLQPEEAERFRVMFHVLRSDLLPQSHQTTWTTRHGEQRLIAWTSTLLPGMGENSNYVIATGIDITERKQLEKAILDISAREQRRIGQDLHDGLGQHLTGIAFMAKAHEARLAEKDSPETEEAVKIVKLVNEAIHKTRELARGLLPVVSEARGLMSALEGWASEVEDLFGISCRFQCRKPVLIQDDNVATHLYHIAQEAVNNAIRHGEARNILIRLSGGLDRGKLMIADDGTGIGERPAGSHGMGMHIMQYRSGMMGGSLEVKKGKSGGTMVTCNFPMRARG